MSKIEGDEVRVLVEPGQSLKDALDDKPLQRKRGRPKKDPEAVQLSKKAKPFDPAWFPAHDAAQEKAKHIRICFAAMVENARLAQALRVLKRSPIRFQNKTKQLQRMLPLWRWQLQELEAAVIDCGGNAALEQEYMASTRAMQYGTRFNEVGYQSDQQRGRDAYYKRDARKQQARLLAKLPKERDVDVSDIDEERAKRIISIANTTRAAEIEMLIWELTQQDTDAKSRYMARMRIRVLVEDIRAFGPKYEEALPKAATATLAIKCGRPRAKKEESES